MKCAVLNCISRFKQPGDAISFFKFPKDPVVRRQWLRFCRTNIDPNSSHICKLHFKTEDFANAFQLEMGLANKRVLKRGAIPRVYIVSRFNKRLRKDRATTIKKIKTKNLMDSVFEDEVNKSFNADEMNHTEFESQSAGEAVFMENNSDENEDFVFTFLTEIKNLRKQNKALKVEAKKQGHKIEAAQKKMVKLEKKQQYKLTVLENKVNRVKNKIERLEEIYEIVKRKYAKKPNRYDILKYSC